MRGTSIVDALSGVRDRLQTAFGISPSEQHLAPVLEDDGAKEDIELSVKITFVESVDTGGTVVDVADTQESGDFKANISCEDIRTLESLAEGDIENGAGRDDDNEVNEDEEYESFQPATQEVLIDRAIYKPSVFYTLQVSNSYMESMVADANMPWGSMAAVKTVIAECSALPSSVVNLTRRVVMFVASGFLSFVVNEVYNSEVLTSGVGVNSYSRVPALIMLLFLPFVEVADYIFGQMNGPEVVSDIYVKMKKRVSLSKT